MTAHNLNHECARVRHGRGVDVVYRLADAMQCGDRADREVRHRHVVVDGAHQARNAQVVVRLELLLGDLSWGNVSTTCSVRGPEVVAFELVGAALRRA